MADLNAGRTSFLEQRRELVANHRFLRGIEKASLVRSDSGWVLRLLFIDSGAPGKNPVPPELGPEKLRISTREGRIDSELRILSVRREGRTAIVELDLPGGQEDWLDGEVEIVGMPRIDPFFASAEFPGGRRSALATRASTSAIDALVDSSKINYLARDYETFRQLMLDRMAELIPEWSERNPADLGIAILEVLAYGADFLSYQQEAIGTEAYLGTARRRVSVHRHARLLDYAMHEGCNARTWVCLALPENAKAVELPLGARFFSTSAEVGSGVGAEASGSDLRDQPLDPTVQVFESVYPIHLGPDREKLELYSWCAEDFFLPAGATSATLLGTPPLERGDLLAFLQLPAGRSSALGGMTGKIERSHVVRLDKAPKEDRDQATGVPITEISWHPEDALPFELWVSRRRGDGVETGLAGVTGNVVLADHGRTMTALLPPVPESGVYEPRLELSDNLTYWVEPDLDALRAEPASAALLQEPREALPAIRLEEVEFRPGDAWEVEPAEDARLFYRGHAAAEISALSSNAMEVAKESEVAASEAAAAAEAARAAAAEAAAAGDALAAARARSDNEGVEHLEESARKAAAKARSAAQTANAAARSAAAAAGAARRSSRAAGKAVGNRRSRGVWKPRRDLIGSDPFERAFVVQCESSGEVTLRFGDGVHGRRPYAGTRFQVVYRVGNGPVGNMGANAIDRVAFSVVFEATNPVPAVGGRAPEELERVRRSAPAAARQERRCITATDYTEAVERHPDVLTAAVRLRTTGSWTTAFVHVQRWGGKLVDESFAAELSAFLNPLLPIGVDLQIADPKLVPLVIHMSVTPAQGYLKKSVHNSVKEHLGVKPSDAGGPHFFDADARGFGEPVRLAELVAAVLDVPGVAAVEVERFERLGLAGGRELAMGEIKIGALEIAALRPQIGGVLHVYGGTD